VIFTVPADLDGERLDRAVAQLAEISRAQAHALVQEGSVWLNQAIALVPSTRVGVGAALEFELPPARPALAPEPIDFEVIWEDEHLAVVNKPAGIVVHPGAGHAGATLAAGFLHRWPQVEGVGEEGRWGMVHRLDKGTSGLLVMAKTSESYAALKSLVAARKLERRYLAMVDGAVEVGTGTIEAAIDRDPSQPMRRRVSASGKPARTHYRRLASWEAQTLLELTLETGRTHQIRVHLAAIDHPVVGDRTYGGPVADVARPWLHSWRLSFLHPLSREIVETVAPLPADLAASLAELGKPAVGSLDELAEISNGDG
jgi:23S rRNA pseudouridine1911/1915/1917 synthase